MNEVDDQRIKNLARAALERDVGQLDEHITTQLQASRQSALSALGAKRRLESMAGWAVAASVLLALNVWWWQPPEATDLSADDFEMMVSDEYIELHEDLDFYSWVGVDSDAS